jgi:hypothetical protein
MKKEDKDRKGEKKKTEIDFTWFVGQGLYLVQMLVAQERPHVADNGTPQNVRREIH